MKRLIGFLAISIVLSLMISCSDDDNNGSSNMVFKAALTGVSEVPSNASTATGNATLIFNNSTKRFTLVVNYSGLTPNDAHIHKGAAGISGGVVFPLTDMSSRMVLTDFSSPIDYTSPALTSAQETDLKNNLYYVNLHTDAYPDGEIRGQLIKQTSSGGGNGGGYDNGGGYGY
ncbi:MAG: CHRD domain-containing protein [Flavobacterium sp.]